MQSDEIKIAVLQNQMQNLDKKVDSIDKKQDELNKQMSDFIKEIRENYVTSRDFEFWRNILIVGILGTIAVGIIARWLNIPVK